MDIKSILEDLNRDTSKKIILDTDTYNEVDDQFALAYAMLSPERLDLLSVNAAPFFNRRSSSPEDGMLKSFDEIFRIMALVDPDSVGKIPVYKGSAKYLESREIPVESDAADNIVNTVMNSNETIYIVAIGAITNVASAIIKCPEIIKKCVLIWLGGNALNNPSPKEFNMVQDIIGASVVFDSGIPLIQIPCDGVCSEFRTTVPEVEYYLNGKNKICDYLVDIVKDYSKGRYAYSKVIWDVTAIAAIVKPDTLDKVMIPAPIICPDGRYSFDASRHHYIYVRRVKRDPLYADLFKKLANEKTDL